MTARGDGARASAPSARSFAGEAPMNPLLLGGGEYPFLKLARIKDALVRQASAPVRWMETIQRMVEQGATHIVECGPGKVLAALTRRIHPEVQSFSLADRASLEQALQAMTGA